MFQSSPGFGAGRYFAGGWIDHVAAAVSILARLWGRALHHRSGYRSAGPLSFNPRPALGPGATQIAAPFGKVVTGFNPRPALGPGATDDNQERERRNNVSILARLWGRALPYEAGRAIFDPVPFQSSPGFGAGRYILPLFPEHTCYAVSILARLWGRALPPAGRMWIKSTAVSILARLWGRALHKKGHWAYIPLQPFQSSPGFGAGRYRIPLLRCEHHPRFQSSPGFGAGRYCSQLAWQKR